LSREPDQAYEATVAEPTAWIVAIRTFEE